MFQKDMAFYPFKGCLFQLAQPICLLWATNGILKWRRASHPPRHDPRQSEIWVLSAFYSHSQLADAFEPVYFDQNNIVHAEWRKYF